MGMTEMAIATTDTGRQVHLALGKRTCCTESVDQVIAVLDDTNPDSRAVLLETLHANRVAPSRLCGHCFYAQLRMAYRKQVADKKAAT
jgi:hypothetical protein